eukprot:17259-Heterococcus_DN1.PRE.1
MAMMSGATPPQDCILRSSAIACRQSEPHTASAWCQLASEGFRSCCSMVCSTARAPCRSLLCLHALSLRASTVSDGVGTTAAAATSAAAAVLGNTELNRTGTLAARCCCC